jgi:hypothetical protein
MTQDKFNRLMLELICSPNCRFRYAYQEVRINNPHFLDSETPTNRLELLETRYDGNEHCVFSFYLPNEVLVLQIEENWAISFNNKHEIGMTRLYRYMKEFLTILNVPENIIIDCY